MSETFYYVYILTSVSEPEKHYTGFTANLEKRLLIHNAGSCSHTKKFAPWQIESAFAFRTLEKAMAFERYLKSHSGRAFAAKHL